MNSRPERSTAQYPSVPKPRKSEETIEEKKDEALDNTIADSFPASDPPSSIPDPDGEESTA
jgi:hypothetical protein